MSSERLPPTIDLALGRSPGLALVLVVAYVLAVMAVFLSGLPLAIKGVVAIGLVVFAIHHVCDRALLLSAHSVCRLIWQSDGECEWQERGGRFHRGELLPGVLVLPALVVVRARMNRWRWRTFCIARDALGEDEMRRLRSRLRVSPPSGAVPGIRQLGLFLRRLGASKARSQGPDRSGAP